MGTGAVGQLAAGSVACDAFASSSLDTDVSPLYTFVSTAPKYGRNTLLHQRREAILAPEQTHLPEQVHVCLPTRADAIFRLAPYRVERRRPVRSCELVHWVGSQQVDVLDELPAHRPAVGV
jgi:hypothetical protein